MLERVRQIELTELEEIINADMPPGNEIHVVGGVGGKSVALYLNDQFDKNLSTGLTSREAYICLNTFHEGMHIARYGFGRGH